MSQQLSITFEKAVRFLTEYMPISDENCRKPYLFHDIRVGFYLYENGYSEEIVIAGILHDIIEWSDTDEQKVRIEFGDNILRLILANSKNDEIKDKELRITDLITRCINNGQEALIIKAADTLDSYKRYSLHNNLSELSGHCMKTSRKIFELKPDNFDDKIFDELKNWQDKFAYLED